MITKYINTYPFEFYETCEACPEQYDVYLEGKLVGYVRLRWAGLSACYPNYEGDQVYSHQWYDEKGQDGYLGQFPDDEQRNFHLEKIAQSLYNRINESETVR